MLAVDESACLGDGAFGIVFKATITQEEKSVDVAVKVIKDCARPHQRQNALETLVCEIQHLVRLGNHKHVVRFLGACTAKLNNGHVLVFLELCPLGSVLNYLGKWKSENVIYSNMIIQSELMQDLEKWSVEIADGMEFLALNKVYCIKIILFM